MYRHAACGVLAVYGVHHLPMVHAVHGVRNPLISHAEPWGEWCWWWPAPAAVGSRRLLGRRWRADACGGAGGRPLPKRLRPHHSADPGG